MTKPEFLVCAKCGNHMVENSEYFYLPAFSDTEIIGKCVKCKTTFNRGWEQ